MGDGNWQHLPSKQCMNVWHMRYGWMPAKGGGTWASCSSSSKQDQLMTLHHKANVLLRLDQNSPIHTEWGRHSASNDLWIILHRAQWLVRYVEVWKWSGYEHVFFFFLIDHTTPFGIFHVNNTTMSFLENRLSLKVRTNFPFWTIYGAETTRTHKRELLEGDQGDSQMQPGGDHEYCRDSEQVETLTLAVVRPHKTVYLKHETLTPLLFIYISCRMQDSVCLCTMCVYVCVCVTCRSSWIQSVCVAWLSLLVLMNWNNFRKTHGS